MSNMYEKILNDKMYQKLMSIKERPGMYLGEKSFIKLEAFIDGYNICSGDYHISKEIELLKLDNDYSFNKFVRNRYDITSNHSWRKIIVFYSMGDSSAFDLFFELFDKYINEYIALKK